MVYLIMCRSLTYAQRVSNALERAGIPARVLRSPGAKAFRLGLIKILSMRK